MTTAILCHISVTLYIERFEKNRQGRKCGVGAARTSCTADLGSRVCGVAIRAKKINILNEKFWFSRLKEFQLSQIKGYSINYCDLF
jgi:hypothetical protein